VIEIVQAREAAQADTEATALLAREVVQAVIETVQEQETKNFSYQ